MNAFCASVTRKSPAVRVRSFCLLRRCSSDPGTRKRAALARGADGLPLPPPVARLPANHSLGGGLIASQWTDGAARQRRRRRKWILSPSIECRTFFCPLSAIPRLSRPLPLRARYRLEEEVDDNPTLTSCILVPFKIRATFVLTIQRLCLW